ncbi:hypothetical protein PN604_09440 [Parabacteroides merdae]|uniref:hypothetical protein n=1 Tax=Parabacteroides merdae TaxID=46503 RepID=UPI00189A7BB7|nr:hypothetical protein [Parabacteroides merdae]MDB8921205.1 hypothetical protein [Parabacteroides merdae]
MGLFDFIFSSKKKEQERLRLEEEERRQRLEQERIAHERERRIEENRRKERERQERLKAEREQAESVQPFTFKSNCHQRYENGRPVQGLQDCIRTVSVVKNTNGCPGYRLQPGIGYIVKIYNDDLGKPNMSDKPMKVVRKTADMLELRGFPIEAQTPFGWQEVDYRDYGFIVHFKEGKVDKCVLHMYDRNVRIEYMKSNHVLQQSDTESFHFNNNVSISAVAQGFTFNLKFSRIQVIKQSYNGPSEEIKVSNNAFAHIVRKESNGVTTFDISNIAELREKGILQSNPSFTPSFSYNSDEEGDEFASAEVGNSFAAMTSDREFVSLFQITRQKGKLVAFIINNLPNEGNYYYLIVFHA